MRTLKDLDRPGSCIILVLNDLERSFSCFGFGLSFDDPDDDNDDSSAVVSKALSGDCFGFRWNDSLDVDVALVVRAGCWCYKVGLV
jgi:hypothetical protein